ncbi:MAG: MFS transporter [Alphaproteobacteria bacterium]|nr:MFS transporter [Alphaproteobacteria bacterium]
MTAPNAEPTLAGLSKAATAHDPTGATRQMYLIFLAAALGMLLDSIVINVYTVTLPAVTDEFDLTAQDIGFISSIFLFGYALGTLSGGTMADYLGRCVSLGISVGLYSIFSALTGAATGGASFAATRFLTGIGTGTELPIGAAYVAEAAPRRWRGFALTLTNSVYSLGIFCASVIVALAANWRWAFASMLVLGAIVYLIRATAEESPRFHKVQAVLADRTLQRRRFTVWEVFAPAYRGATLRIMMLWIGYWTFWWSWVIFVPRYLITEAHVGQAEIAWYMGAFGLGGFLCQNLSGYLCDIVGRRWTIIAFTGIGVTALWLWIAYAVSPAAPMLGGIAFASLLAPVPPMLAHTAETFPTTLRGTGQSVTIGIARLVSVAGPTAAGLVVAKIGLASEFKLASVLLLLTVLAAWYGPETRGIALDDGLAEKVSTPAAAGTAS